MYWRTNPIKHNVATVWVQLTDELSSGFILVVSVHCIIKFTSCSRELKPVCLSLAFHGLSCSPCTWTSTIVLTNDFLQRSFSKCYNSPFTNLLWATPAETVRWWPILHDIKSQNETNIHPWREQKTDGEERPSDNLNPQLQYEKESFKCSADGPGGGGGVRGSCPSPNTTTGLLDDCWVWGFVFGIKIILGQVPQAKLKQEGEEDKARKSVTDWFINKLIT